MIYELNLCKELTHHKNSWKALPPNEGFEEIAKLKEQPKRSFDEVTLWLREMNQSGVDQCDTDFFAILNQGFYRYSNLRIDEGLEIVRQETSEAIKQCLEEVTGFWPFEIENWKRDQTDHRAFIDLFESGVVEEAGLFVRGTKKPHDNEQTIKFVGPLDEGMATVGRALRRGDMRWEHLSQAQYNKVIQILGREEFRASIHIWTRHYYCAAYNARGQLFALPMCYADFVLFDD